MKKIRWQAHRGGGANDVPDNTLASFEFAWKLGAIPEADVRTTKDGVIVCFHDETVERTTDALSKNPEYAGCKISDFDFREIREWDAGSYFSPEYAGERIPSLEEALLEMEKSRNREIYLDLKDVDITALTDLLRKFELVDKAIVATPSRSECAEVKRNDPDLRTMLWIGGSNEEIQSRFRQVAEAGFPNLDQVQLHLSPGGNPSKWPFALDESFLTEALSETASDGVDLEVFVFNHTDEGTGKLLDMGISWYAVDDARKFYDYLEAVRKRFSI